MQVSLQDSTPDLIRYGRMTQMRWQWMAATLLLVSGCNAPETDMTEPDTRIEWAQLAGQKIVFAHQSVGKNILQGAEQLARRDGIDLRVQERRGAPTEAGITHFNVGNNGDPLGKIRDFAAAMDSGAATDADVVVLKLCYIDFSADSAPGEIANAYISTLEQLDKRYPGTLFVPVTAPLTTVQTGPKAWIKQLLGKQPAQYAENAKRSEFNRLIRKHYGNGGRLFDLAHIEAGTGNSQTTVRIAGQEIETLDPSLTDDGGHLNTRGQILVATAFLNLIATQTAR
jgi:lysophospholipase L1-like esterase